MNWTLPKQVFTVLAGSLSLAAYPLAAFANRDVIIAITAGALLSTVNILLGYAAIQYAADKSMTTFANTVIGGMGIRLVVLLGIMTFLILVLDFHTAALTASLFFYYAVYLILEILYIQQKVHSTPSHDARARS